MFQESLLYKYAIGDIQRVLVRPYQLAYPRPLSAKEVMGQPYN